MYVRKLSDGKWRCEVEKHGHRPTKVFDTKVEAQRWGQAKEIELDALKGSAGKTFGPAVAYYLKTVSPTKVDALEWETRRFKAMTEFFGADTPLVKITSATIGKWRDHRLQSVTGATVLREKNLLSNLLKLAHDEWKWISHEPCRGVRWPEEGDAREHLWRWKDIRKVYRQLQSGGPKMQQVGWAFMTALRTAMRLNEVLAAQLSGSVALLPREKTSQKVVRAPVKVPLTRHGVKWMKRKPEVTVGANEASALFTQAAQACGVREKGVDGATFHDTRATALTCLARKVDVLTLSRISRHRDINILMKRYYRETAEQIAARL